MSRMHDLFLNQEQIAVEVDYFDERAKAELSSYPTHTRIAEIAGKTISIPTGEILTYFLFHKPRLHGGGLSHYQSLAREQYSAIAMLDRYVEPNGTSLCIVTGQRVGTYIPEYLGEAVGLSVINRLHSMTESDWKRIEQEYGRRAAPTFDYEHELKSSDGKSIIQLEAKGSVVEDCRKHCANTQNHRAKIEEKKRKIKKSGAKYRYPADLRYGTITAIDRTRDRSIKCWLVDPEADEDTAPAANFKLLARMAFLRDCVQLVSPRSPLAAVLQDRVAVLEALKNPFELEGVSLRHPREETLGGIVSDSVFPRRAFGRSVSRLFPRRSHVVDGPTAGEIFPGPGCVLFCGFQEELIELAIEQEFDRIISYRRPSATIEKTVECVVTRKRFLREFDVMPSLRPFAEGSKDLINFRLTGRLYYAPSGTVVGRLNV